MRNGITPDMCSRQLLLALFLALVYKDCALLFQPKVFRCSCVLVMLSENITILLKLVSG